MPLFGAHMSIQGGHHQALLSAQAYGFDTVQLFTRNASQWAVRDIPEERVVLFQRALRQTRLKQPMAHDSYLINPASPRKDLFRRSIEALVVEMQRAEQLGLHYLVIHPGSHVGTDEQTGLAHVVEALDEVHGRCPDFRARILLETTAGQGLTLGHRFEQLAGILDRVAEPGRLGVCLDTCHVFAAGYPLAPEEDYARTFESFDKVIGLKRLCVFHVNDSARPRGSRVDRHAHLGWGCLGLEAFRLLVNDPRFRRHPMILETPKQREGQDMDRENLGILRRLLALEQLEPQAGQRSDR